MGNNIQIVDIERGMPTVDEARKLLIASIDQACRSKIPVLKIIHGYGSSGKGGKLKDALRKSLIRRRSESKVDRIIFGEKWHIFDETTQEFLRDYPQLDRDADLGKGNEGITFVEVCRYKTQSKT